VNGACLRVGRTGSARGTAPVFGAGSLAAPETSVSAAAYCVTARYSSRQAGAAAYFTIWLAHAPSPRYKGAAA